MSSRKSVYKRSPLPTQRERSIPPTRRTSFHNSTLNTSISRENVSSEGLPEKIECEIQYNKYLQALFMQVRVEKAIASKINACNDQLHMYSELLLKAQLKLEDLKTKKERLENLRLLKKKREELKAMQKIEFIDSMHEKQMQFFTQLRSLLASEAMKLRLNEFDPVTTKSEYERIEGLIEYMFNTIKQKVNQAGGINTIVATRTSIDQMVDNANMLIADSENASNDLNRKLVLIIHFASDYFAKHLI